ncbi:MAG: PAS domain S-box protein [Bacteroidetes bacterium]|nr:PAS domain S-box protein [Bacteroidota bacterium]
MPVFTRSFSILIIEDNPGDFVLIEDYLRDQVLNPNIKNTTTFKDTKELLEKGEIFDIIFLDLTLPDATGKQLVSELLEIAGDTPIIALTGYEDKDFSIKTLSLGISDYLFKDDLNPSLLYKSIIYNIERKRISIELQESEKKYRTLFHLCPIPMWVYDPETLRFLNVNNAAVKHYGYSLEEFLSITIKEIRPIAEIEKLEAVIEKNKHSISLYSGIFNHRKKNGSIISVEIQSNKIIFNGREAKLIIAIDVTEKLKAEEALKLSEKLFKALVQDGADLISILDETGNYKFVSPSASSIIGIDSNELIGKNAFDYIHEDDRQRVVNQFNLLKRKKRVQISPFRFKNVNNNWIWLETIATNMIDDPAVQGIISNSRDITLNINYNQKLKQNFERYESLAKATSDAIWDHDFEIDRTYIAGEGYRNLFGYNVANQFSEELFWEARLHPDEKESIIRSLNDLIENPNIIQSELEYRFLKADGNYAHVCDRFFIIRDNGKAVRMLGAKQDITRQKIEEQEKEKLITELIQNNKDLKQFSYITSHNLRGPIANLLGLSSLIDNYDIKDETLKQILSGIKKATFMFDDIIKDLTKVLNVKDHISIPQEDLDILTAFEKGIAQNETIIIETGAEIKTDLNKGLTLKFNKAYLESIFFNLISNAIKYRSPARNLKILLSSETTKEEVILKFSDNGLGLDVELYKERLFRLYQRFHDHAEGKGLGLFLIKSQMEALNGSIDIESKVGTGTTFILRFKR